MSGGVATTGEVQGLLAGTPLAGLNIPQTPKATTAAGSTPAFISGPATEAFNGQWPTQQNNLNVNSGTGGNAAPANTGGWTQQNNLNINNAGTVNTGQQTQTSQNNQTTQQQQTQQPLNAAQQEADNVFLSALSSGNTAEIAQTERNFGLPMNQLSSSQIQALTQANAQGDYILSPTVFGQIVGSSGSTGSSSTAGAQGGSSASQPTTYSPTTNFWPTGEATNGFGQYDPNLVPQLTLTPQDQAQVQQIMSTYDAQQLEAEANALPAGSPYKAAYEQEAQSGLGENSSGYNAAGQPIQVLDYGSEYAQVEQAAAATGQTISPELAAQLQQADAYAASHSSLVYGDATSSGGTNFGGGDGGADYSDPVQTTVIPGVTPGLTGATTPTEQSTQPGGLFGDALPTTTSSAFPDYQGYGQTTVNNTGTPYQQGVTGVSPGSVVITGPAAPPEGVDPGTVTYPVNAADGTLGVPSTGNAAGNGAVYNPETEGLQLLEPLFESLMGEGSAATSPANDVFEQQSGATNVTPAIANAEANNYGSALTNAGASAPSTSQNFADGILQGILEQMASGRAAQDAGASAAGTNLLNGLSGLF